MQSFDCPVFQYQVFVSFFLTPSSGVCCIALFRVYISSSKMEAFLFLMLFLNIYGIYPCYRFPLSLFKLSIELSNLPIRSTFILFLFDVL